jgi:hypothetical protein
MHKNPLLPANGPLVTGADLSADYTSVATDIRYQDNITYQVNVTTGAPIGVLDVEVSTDYNPITHNSGTWTPLGTAYRAVINGTGAGMFALNQLEPIYSRLKYTRTSGTGLMDIYISGKQV